MTHLADVVDQPDLLAVGDPEAAASLSLMNTNGSPRWVLSRWRLVMFIEWMLQRGWPLVRRSGDSPPWCGLSLCTGSSSPASRYQS